MSFDSQEPPKKKSKLPLILGIIAACGLLMVACCGGFAWFGFGMVTAPRDAAIAAMENNAQVTDALGTPLEAGSKFSLSNFQNNNNNGSASIGFDVVGPKGTADVNADMKLTAGTWTVETLSAEMSDGTVVNIPPGAAAEGEPETELELTPVE